MVCNFSKLFNATRFILFYLISKKILSKETKRIRVQAQDDLQKSMMPIFTEIRNYKHFYKSQTISA